MQKIVQNIRPAVVVFLVALPLCLGIALASNAPALSGIIAGIVGGIVVGAISKSSVSVSGPAAGLTVIVANAITDLGSFDLFLVAVVIGGLIQIGFGLLKLGFVRFFFPSPVIKGMLSAIGLILIMKQIPHALGIDSDYEGDQSFIQPDNENTFTELFKAFTNISPGPALVFAVGLLILIFSELKPIKKAVFFKIIPAPLLVVLLGSGAYFWFQAAFPQWAFSASQLVNIPVAESGTGIDFQELFVFPDWSAFGTAAVYQAGIVIALVASIESLLSVEAADNLNPRREVTPINRELLAQGCGNTVSGLIGGLPVTAVIVRSSANIASGATHKSSAVMHGIFLAAFVIFATVLLNTIPLAALAAVLILVGYKLASIKVFKKMWDEGKNRFIPFIITVVAILFTDLLIGIGVGFLVGLSFTIRQQNTQVFVVTKINENYLVRAIREVSFLNKAEISQKLDDIPENSQVLIDLTRASRIDPDIKDIIEAFEGAAEYRNIDVTIEHNNENHGSVPKITA